MGHRAGVNPATNERTQSELIWPVSAHGAGRLILSMLPGASTTDFGATEIESRGRADDPPVLAKPGLIEGSEFRAIRVAPEKDARLTSGFAGFVDGTQDVRIVGRRKGIPIVWGTVGAAVRVRENRRLATWRRHLPAVEHRYYIPFRYVKDISRAFRDDPRVIDTAPDSPVSIPSRHPAALLEAAIQLVQSDRERLEQRFAEAWCKAESSVLYIDGSITASRLASTSPLAVGVIKSHRTLYADGDAFDIVVGLCPGERSSVFRVSPKSRHPVASWYVRVRSAIGRDALFGLVRVEAAESPELSARADEISRWIIAEGSPLALPDSRWDKMSYGIRDTEEFLRAIS